MRATAILILACAIAAAPARANDSVAEVAIGGLTLTKTDAIRMDSEDLYISREIVRVKYRFTNTTDLPIDALVAFPLPDISLENRGYACVDNVWTDPSELRFKTSVDGQPFAQHVVEQAFFKGEDVSARLSALHIPLNPLRVIPLNPLGIYAPNESWPESRDRLAADGLIKEQGYYDDDWVGLWTMRTAVTRHQTFPPRKTVTVEHEYAPRVSENPNEESWSLLAHHPAANVPELRRKYCIDDPWFHSFHKKDENKGSDYNVRTLGYVLKTGANWKGPIGHFRLVVDTGKPDSLVSFCAESIKQISPTQFEVHHSNFTPTEDLHILFVRW